MENSRAGPRVCCCGGRGGNCCWTRSSASGMRKFKKYVTRGWSRRTSTGTGTCTSCRGWLRSRWGWRSVTASGGYVDAALKKTATRLQESRQAELEILTDEGIRKLVASQGIRLIDYAFVAQEA